MGGSGNFKQAAMFISVANCIKKNKQTKKYEKKKIPNPGLKFNPSFFIFLFKNLWKKIFPFLFRTSNHHVDH